MPRYKVDLIFHQSTNRNNTTSSPIRTAGWSEGLYINASLTAVQAATDRLCQIRAAMLTQAGSIVGQRFRLVGGGSSVLTKRYPGTLTTNADVPQMALLVSAQSKTTPNVRRWTLRGLPDDRVAEGEFNPTGAVAGHLSSYAQELDRGGWQFRARDLTEGKSEIFAISNAGEVQLVDALDVAQFDFVRISGALDANGNTVNGRFRVSEVDNPLQWTLANWTAGPTTGGRAYFDAYDYYGINGLTFVVSRVVTRKVGRSFFQYVGRRSNRR